MFHICFCANEAYIKYTAVLINSIIKATDTHKDFSHFFNSINDLYKLNCKQRERESNSHTITTSRHCENRASDSWQSRGFASNARGLPREASLARNDKTNCRPEALAEVSLHCETYEVSRGNLISSVIASEQSERGKTRQSRSFFSNLNGTASDFRNAQLAIQGDCHESAFADSRNDENVNCHDFALQNLTMTEKTRDCHAKSSDFARNDGNSAFANNNNVISHSLAEGVRGWVKIPKQTHLDSFVKRDFASLSESEKQEGYIFHILSDFVSKDSRAKLDNLANDLSQIYPCEIQIHICESTLFSGLPTLNGNYLTYFRFFIPRFMPSECKICLYLDIDMLVLGDLRELFALKMGKSCVGIVKDYILSNAMQKRPALLPKTPDFEPITFSGTHFNAGFMLINLSAWQGQNITQKCFSVMKNYHLDMHDQDTLNAVIAESNRLKLPFAFNCLPRAFLQSICNDESAHFKFDYTRKEMNCALKNPVILHFTSGIQKSWQVPRIYNTQGQNISALWWEIALKTPEFSEILSGDFEALRQNPHKIFESYTSIYLPSFTRSFIGFLRLPLVVAKIFSEFEQGILDLSNFKNLDSRKLTPSEYNFAFDLFLLAQKSWKRRKKGDLLILPFRAIKLKSRHKKYGIIKIKAN